VELHRISDRRPIKSKSEQRASDSEIESRDKFVARAKVIQRCQRIASRASGSAARALHALLSFANTEGYCWPLASALTDVTELARSRLFLALGELESLGIIDRRMLVSRVNGRNAPTLYRVGGKVTRLPKNAERYILANKRKPKSRGSKRCEVHKTRTSQPRGEVLETRTGVVLETRTGVVLETRIQKLSMEVAAPIEAADAVAIGSIRGVNREFSALESDAGGQRHPPSEPASKSDDNRHRERRNSSTSQKQTTPRRDSIAFRNAETTKRKAKALANTKAKYKNEFSDDYILSAFEAIDGRARKPIGTAEYYETAFRNGFTGRDDRVTEAQKELRVGEGPQIVYVANASAQPTCTRCGRSEKFHNKTLHIKKHIDPHWIDHPFSLIVVDDVPDAMWDLTRQRF
jgi:hypothetical protein